MRSLSTSTIAERGSAVVLAPALMLVMLTLATVAVDLSAHHHAHRSLHRAVATTADDAAGLLDGRHLQLTGSPRIDQDAATQFVVADLRGTTLPGRLVGSPLVSFDRSGTSITVQATFEIDHVVAAAFGAGRTTSTLVITAHARMLP